MLSRWGSGVGRIRLTRFCSAGVNGYLNEAGVIGNIKTEAFTFLKTLEQQEQNCKCLRIIDSMSQLFC